MTGTVTSTLKAACPQYSDWGIDKVVRRALNEFRPDVVHLHNIHSYISPRVAQLAREAGCRVVWTLHDYKLLCGAYSFLCGGKICTDCIANSPFAMVRRRCMKNSLSASVLAYAEAKVWSRRRISSWVDAFICPSEFMREKMIEGGFESHRLHVLNNFVDTEVFNAGSESVMGDATSGVSLLKGGGYSCKGSGRSGISFDNSRNRSIGKRPQKQSWQLREHPFCRAAWRA